MYIFEMIKFEMMTVYIRSFQDLTFPLSSPNVLLSVHFRVESKKVLSAFE